MIEPESLSRIALFADLSDPELEAAAQLFDEQVFQPEERVLRMGISGSAFYVVLEGEASVRIDGQERARLRPGDFFGEISILLGDAPVADVLALQELRCAVLASPDVEPFLLRNPPVMLRMLRVSARRLRNANLWQS